MTAATRVIIADGMTDAGGDAGAFIASVVDEVNAAWARRGVAGVEIVCAEWENARRRIFLETIPGAQSLTVGRVSEHLKAERAKVAERFADGMGKLL
ncbi:hypothetical protein [Aureimonas sp. AU12]|uniref:hypothetical protein n=1 Tax=Aureimonas sp. AU12 TaxID=1638161 RepID=UPI000785BDAE|nr:hypothetical protein [Aureimonas sp. AU12]